MEGSGGLYSVYALCSQLALPLYLQRRWCRCVLIQGEHKGKKSQKSDDRNDTRRQNRKQKGDCALHMQQWDLLKKKEKEGEECRCGQVGHVQVCGSY